MAGPGWTTMEMEKETKATQCWKKDWQSEFGSTLPPQPYNLQVMSLLEHALSFTRPFP